MIIGLPKAMLYYRYHVLWETFFRELNCDVITSGDSNKRILADGIKFSIDECCLPSKVYMGHVHSLIGKCDYILIPRIVNYGKNKDVCVRFNALYDIARNTFDDIKIIDYNIDYVNGETERKGFIKMGKFLGNSSLKSLNAYKEAKKAEQKTNEKNYQAQINLLEKSNNPKILIVSHPYNLYDKLIGEPIAKYIEKLGGIPIYADRVDKKISIQRSKEISSTLYWLYNKELIGSIKLYEDKIDGIILLTAFPCGPDSLVNELVIRRVKNIPLINIIVDELQSETGLQTRIESFMDIIEYNSKKEREKVTERRVNAKGD